MSTVRRWRRSCGGCSVPGCGLPGPRSGWPPRCTGSRRRSACCTCGSPRRTTRTSRSTPRCWSSFGARACMCQRSCKSSRSTRTLAARCSSWARSPVSPWRTVATRVPPAGSCPRRLRHQPDLPGRRPLHRADRLRGDPRDRAAVRPGPLPPAGTGAHADPAGRRPCRRVWRGRRPPSRARGADPPVGGPARPAPARQVAGTLPEPTVRPSRRHRPGSPTPAACRCPLMRSPARR